MKHYSNDDTVFLALAQDGVTKVFEVAQREGLCPTCTIATLAAFCGAQLLLREDCVRDGTFTPEASAVWGMLADATADLALALDKQGWTLEPGAKPPSQH